MKTTAALLLVAAAGCIHLPREPQPTPQEGAWASVRDRMTRSGKLYDGLSTNAFAQVLYFPRDARDALVARVAVWKALTVEETDRMLVAQRDDATRYEEFILALFTPDPANDDLDAPSSVWRVALVIEGGPDILPESIHAERKDAMVRALYPFVNDFNTVYRVRFPRKQALEGRSFVLRMAGALGRLDFDYGVAR